MKRIKSIAMAVVVMAFVWLSISSVAVAADSTTGSKYHVYTFNKPQAFETLEAFVKDTFTDELDQGTLAPVSIDGKPGVTFWTDGVGIRNFHLLIQDDATLTLMTTAELDITPDDDTVSVNQRTTANSIRPLSVSIGPIFNACTTAANAGNCVKYVRCLAPWLPAVDLTTLVAKKSLINSSTPAVGAVAVIQVSGQYAINGHLAYITAVNKDAKGQVTTITISESHYIYSAGFDMRTDSPQNLHVVGYVARK